MSKYRSLRSSQRPKPGATVLSLGEGTTNSIGADFETADTQWHTDAPQRAPWDFPEATVEYVQTGRHALAAIAERLRKRGHDRVVLPGHFCESMTSPFIKAGFEIVPVAVTDPVRMDLDRIWDAVQESVESTVFFGMLFFGEEPDNSYVDFVRTLASDGVPVIDDETHRVFRPGGVNAEFAIGSLRKLLPVADGAYIRHGERANIISDLITNNAGDLRWAAMDAKALNKPYSFTAMQEANSALETELTAARISNRSISSLKSLNYTKLSTQRVANARALVSALEGSGVQILERNWNGIVPSHLVVRTRDSSRLQHDMAARRIYCPIHWTSPTANFPGLKWRDDLLSVPIDHRYRASDMERAASTLRKLWVP